MTDEPNPFDPDAEMIEISLDEAKCLFAFRRKMRRLEFAVGLALIARVLWLVFRHDGGALDFTWGARG